MKIIGTLGLDVKYPKGVRETEIKSNAAELYVQSGIILGKPVSIDEPWEDYFFVKRSQKLFEQNQNELTKRFFKQQLKQRGN